MKLKHLNIRKQTILFLSLSLSLARSLCISSNILIQIGTVAQRSSDASIENSRQN
ncbi:Hypothetical predicted protein [Olea europaea subsp. europaea]|uniref:Uncharacterized protein n=1 Tax=Olea europaea subsp. europaea TaxID=158383 RepID=A0A8S0SXQ8_OLEEU|nr:Hypothetical predicted protein [Olea europaea subsp. europaea]